MPTVTVDRNDLLSLIGSRLSEKRLNEVLSSLKCETELVTDGELTYEVTSDRPDLFSVEGLARAARTLLGKRQPEALPAKPMLALKVGKSVDGIRPFIVAAAVYGVSLTEKALIQLMQLQERLHGTYAAGRKKASIGIYDLDTVQPPFSYGALPPERISFTPLEEDVKMNGKEILEKTPKGREYAAILEGLPRYPLLSDCRGTVLSMPPIINSNETRLRPTTRDLFIDVTGTSEQSINLCLNIVVTSLLERGGRYGRVAVDYPQRHLETPKMDWAPFTLHLEMVQRVSGLDLDLDSARTLLNRMGMKASSRKKGLLEVLVPPFRFDVMHEVDLVEDIIMAYGLNRIPPQYSPTTAIGRRLSSSRLRSRARDLMIGMGFQEITTYMLTNEETSAKSLADRGPHAAIGKPVSNEYSMVRGSLIPEQLAFLGSNAHQPCPQKIFENGDAVNIRGGRAATSTLLSAAISDHSISFEEIQAVSSSFFKNLSMEVTYRAADKEAFIAGRCAQAVVGGRTIGTLGEVKPSVLTAFGIGNPTAIMELEISALYGMESLFLG